MEQDRRATVPLREKGVVFASGLFGTGALSFPSPGAGVIGFLTFGLLALVREGEGAAGVAGGSRCSL